ncbi:hypothetical protein POM88_002746 [Heracleum sosnowskyi]|uniref:Cystatin domain-containing protein n=1 Tax=Heracleum sosnowskyi TaxID=360622 RepID=A0AAD8NCA1_9APIA|nr:hypothetical protein POM88_002746 [Heracleum sosnowskyi]
MALKSYIILLTLVALSLLVLPGQGYPPSQWQPIENLNDPHVQDVATFAVKTYNSRLHDETQYLDYLKIVKGEYLQSGFDGAPDYRLNIVAKQHDDGVVGNYQTFVHDDIWFKAKIYVYLIKLQK